MDACLLKSIRSAFGPGITGLIPLSFYSGGGGGGGGGGGWGGGGGGEAF